MLGPFGETLVVDWGLAKVLSRAGTGGDGAGAEQTLQPAALRSQEETVAGSVLGTPAYMSPEQAAGRLEELSPASDVYSLGATLYTVLTDCTPFDGADPRAVLGQVQRGDFRPPRQVRPAVPPALDAVCRKAMARNPGARYPTPLALAADVERWLADEPVSAHRDPLAVRLVRWGRRHQRLVAGGTALLVTAVAALAVGLLAVNAERRRTLAEQERTRAALEAEARRRQQTRQALDALTGKLVGGWLIRQPQLAPENTAFLKQALQSYEEFARDTDQDEATRVGVAAAYGRIAMLHRALGQGREAEAAYGHSRDRYAQLAADFPTNPEYHDQLARAHTNRGTLFETVGRPQEAGAEYRKALAVYGGLAPDLAARPEVRQGIARSHNSLAVLYKINGRLKEAEAEYREALAIQEQLAAEFPDRLEFRWDLAQSHHNLSILLRDTERWQQGEASCRQALALQQRLAGEDPNNPEYRHELAGSYNALGNFLLHARKPKEAEEAFRNALTLHRGLALEFPARLDYRQELAADLNNRGILFYQTGRPQEAEAAYREGLAMSQRLARDSPQVPTYQNEVAGGMVNLALVLRDQGKLDEAVRLLQEAVPYHQAALRVNPQHPAYRSFYCNNRWALAGTYLRLGQHAEAAAAAEEYARLAVRPAGDLYPAACYLARCVPLAEKDAKLPPSRRQELAEGYAARAVALLRQAVQKGYNNVPHLKKDPDLDALRQRPDFRELLADLEAKAPGN
jgi:tetratricopeptide (TPR) repeat protein